MEEEENFTYSEDVFFEPETIAIIIRLLKEEQEYCDSVAQECLDADDGYASFDWQEESYLCYEARQMMERIKKETNDFLNNCKEVAQ